LNSHACVERIEEKPYIAQFRRENSRFLVNMGTFSTKCRNYMLTISNGIIEDKKGNFVDYWRMEAIDDKLSKAA
jgi:hypothetical protein